MAPTVAFRTDASLEIGSGHVMRCLTLAEALRRQGAACRFLMREHRGHLIDSVRRRGFGVVSLGGDTQSGKRGALPAAPAHASWLGCSWRADAEQTRRALGHGPVDWLVVDHYALDAEWERSLSDVCRHLLVIDDLADRPHHCDVLLDQNLGRDGGDYAALVPEGCELLIGPAHALLRPEFAAHRADSLLRRRPPRLQHLLVALGGVDAGNATGRVLTALRDSPLTPESSITVVMGRQAPWLQSVQAQAADMPWPCKVLVQVDDMARLMADCDVAIGAAGGSAWERCSVGLPCLLIVLADNQRAGARALAASGAAIMLADEDDLPAELGARIASLKSADALSRLVDAASAVTDGRGLERVIPHLLGPARV